MRLLHMADAHFGRRFSSSRFGPEAAAARRRALEAALRLLVDYANENAVDAILCAGDLIESAEIRPADLRTLRDILSGLKTAKMYAVSGNHDPLDALSPYGRLNCDKLHLLPAGYSRIMLNEDTALHAFSFPEAVVRHNPLEEAPLDLGAKRNILLLHCDAISPESDYLPARMNFLRRFDYCALGHVHQPLELAPGIRYSGSILGMDRNETGPRGFVVVETDGPTAEFVPLPLPTYESRSVELSAQDGGAEARILEALEPLPRDSLVSITLTGTHPAGARPDTEALAERLRTAGRQTYLIDETLPAYDLKTLAAEHRDDLAGQVIAAFGPEEAMTGKERLALEYALTALMEGGRRA